MLPIKNKSRARATEMPKTARAAADSMRERFIAMRNLSARVCRESLIEWALEEFERCRAARASDGLDWQPPDLSGQYKYECWCAAYNDTFTHAPRTDKLSPAERMFRARL